MAYRNQSKCAGCGMSIPFVPEELAGTDAELCSFCYLKSGVAVASQEELDNMVHDLKSLEASAINNAGREAQAKYILEGAE